MMKLSLLKIKNQIYTHVYVVLIFIILTNIFHGKLFLTDFIPVVSKNFDLLYGRTISTYGGDLPFNISLIFIPTEIFQKLIFFMILFLSGYSMYNFIGSVVSSKIAQFYGSSLYMINPYTYIRIVVGQWSIIFYAVIPLLLKVFIALLEKKEKKEMIKFTFLLSIVAFNIHMLIIALIIMSIIFIFWTLKYRDIRNIKVIPIAIIIFILLNFYWIFPLMTAKNTIIDNIGEEDYKVFAPKIDNLSDLFDIASMYGFWREGYIYAKDFISYWQLLSIFIISLAIYGFVSFCRDEKIGYIVKALGVIGIIGFILATGINGPFGDINHWLYDNTILKGFRDSHKFVAMIVFAYAILGGLGITKLENMKRRATNENDQ